MAGDAAESGNDADGIESSAGTEDEDEAVPFSLRTNINHNKNVVSFAKTHSFFKLTAQVFQFYSVHVPALGSGSTPLIRSL